MFTTTDFWPWLHGFGEGNSRYTKAPAGQETPARLLRVQGNAGCTGKPPHLGRAGTNFRIEVK